MSYIITVAIPDPNSNHGSEVSLPLAKDVGIFGVENCSAGIFTYCILKTGKIDMVYNSRSTRSKISGKRIQNFADVTFS